jgi:hypothetical protein
MISAEGRYTKRGTKMTKLTRRTLSISVFGALFAASLAAAQSPQTVRVRGTIEGVDGQTLTVKSRDGNALTIKLADNPRVTAMVKAVLADIKVGDFIRHGHAAARW